MKIIDRILLAAFIVSFSGNAYASSMMMNESGVRYQNQRGSTLTLIRHAETKTTGRLSGTFTSAVGNKACVNVPVPVQGFYNGNAMSISMSFPGCGSVFGLMGNFMQQNTVLDTMWMGTKNTSDPVQRDWNANLVGHDHFMAQ